MIRDRFGTTSGGNEKVENPNGVPFNSDREATGLPSNYVGKAKKSRNDVERKMEKLKKQNEVKKASYTATVQSLTLYIVPPTSWNSMLK